MKILENDYEYNSLDVRYEIKYVLHNLINIIYYTLIDLIFMFILYN